jgi:hypothetical protein
MSDQEDHPSWEKEESEAYRMAEMEDDLLYQAAHEEGMDLFEPEPWFPNEHDDSAWQCGKDRDDR